MNRSRKDGRSGLVPARSSRQFLCWGPLGPGCIPQHLRERGALSIERFGLVDDTPPVFASVLPVKSLPGIAPQRSGRKVTRALLVSVLLSSVSCTLIDSVDGYEGDQVAGARDADVGFDAQVWPDAGDASLDDAPGDALVDTANPENDAPSTTCTPGIVNPLGACSQCGKLLQTCTDEGKWGPPECTDQGVCEAGASQAEACGNCGTRSRACNAQCDWDPYSACGGEGACAPGSTTQFLCDGCSQLVCQSNCQWGGCELKPGNQCEYKGGTTFQCCAPGAWQYCSPSCQWFGCQACSGCGC